MLNKEISLSSIMKGKVCPYCKRRSVFVDSSEVYGTSYGMIYLCRPCKAWVGVHKGTNKSLGRLANSNLREYKKEAHKYFDQIWKSGKMTRHGAYKWLSNELHIKKEFTHIGMFNEETCQKVINLSKRIINSSYENIL